MAHQEFRQNINPRHAQQAEEEEEMLRRAIAESEAMAREGQTSTRETELVPVHQPHHATDRVYDDDDPELQAALQASLQPSHEWEEIPPHLLQLPTPLQMPKQTTPAQGQISTDDTVNDTDTASETDATTEPETDIVERDVSMEEMRRRRLARFEG
jgi:ataxin-3